ncbi:unnamed protein product [Eruca vesicaria subsp. sativa]|uniref:Cyclin-dependent kinase inhibitor domain-containing protein n=1 Tax=Eruca vesicaria subsp. sativa TaxID=29727 RepID=A0ABC8J1A1_ERUVS|nr:unnamed protein product [Eruca vesicaria subsp. sativa]
MNPHVKIVQRFLIILFSFLLAYYKATLFLAISLMSFRRKHFGSCSITCKPSGEARKRYVSTILNLGGYLSRGESSCKCTCYLAYLAEFDAVAGSRWVPIGDKVLLMAGIFLTYMAGVIPLQNSGYSSTKKTVEENPDVGTSESSGRDTDSEGDLKSVLDVVKGNLLDSLDAIKRESTLGRRVLKAKPPQGKLPLSLNLKRRSAYICFLQYFSLSIFGFVDVTVIYTSGAYHHYKSSVSTKSSISALSQTNKISNTINTDDWMISFTDIVREAYQGAGRAWLTRELSVKSTDSGWTKETYLLKKVSKNNNDERVGSKYNLPKIKKAFSLPFPLSRFLPKLLPLPQTQAPVMGKYMKKSKVTNDTEPTEPTSLGVRTRAAKTLALKRLNSSASDPALAADSSCYLQLRSRRLEKPVALTEPKQGTRIKESGGSKGPVNSGSGSVRVAQSCDGDEGVGKFEAFVGENSLDFESRQSTRESTPCNFVGDVEINVTPGSSTKTMRTAATDYTRDRDSLVPSAGELEEFFAYAEQEQQRLFMEKYNFDIVNDVPLTGRYEWVQVSP